MRKDFHLLLILQDKKMADLHIIEGGVGKHLQFTALFDALLEKNQESKLCLQSGFPDIFRYDTRVATSEVIAAFALFYSHNV